MDQHPAILSDLGAELRRRRDELIEHLGRFGCEEILAGKAENVFRELEALSRSLRQLPEVEAVAARAAAIARATAFRVLADALDHDLPGNCASGLLRAEAVGI
jgi:hypothetical protein